MKADKYIADRKAKLQELQEECNKMALEYGKFDIKFLEERERGDKLLLELQNMEEQHKFLKSLSHKQRLEIIDYE